MGAIQISPIDGNNLALAPTPQGGSFDNFPNPISQGGIPLAVCCGVFHRGQIKTGEKGAQDLFSTGLKISRTYV
jgi:hypothetical protein